MWLRFFWCENQKKCEKKSPFCWAILTMWMCICVCVPVFFLSRLVCRMCECLCMFVSAFFRLYSKHHIILWRSEKGLKFSKWFFFLLFLHLSFMCEKKMYVLILCSEYVLVWFSWSQRHTVNLLLCTPSFPVCYFSFLFILFFLPLLSFPNTATVSISRVINVVGIVAVCFSSVVSNYFLWPNCAIKVHSFLFFVVFFFLSQIQIVSSSAPMHFTLIS